MNFEIAGNYAEFIEVGEISGGDVCLKITDGTTDTSVLSFIEPKKAKLLASALMTVALSIEVGES